MKMLMPANVSAVKQYRDGQPLFSRMGVESQLDAMFSPTVQLRSGGYIVINQTEALVSIDVNSGRSTREHHIEDTALKTNLEASEEVARQLRLRDLAGLIVIDFIDMDEKRNNRAVERKLSDCLRQDRARIQVGRISHFGLLEMSRQRIRASVLESSTDPCPHCGGTGHVRSVSSVALQLLRGLEEILMKGATHNLVVRTRTDVALYVLNHKRGHLRDLENGFKVTLSVIADPSVSGPQAYLIDRGEQVHTLEAAKALLVAQAAASPPPLVEEAYDDEEFDSELESEVETEETEGLTEEQAAGDAAPEQDGQRRKRRRRRRGRGGQRDGELREDSAPTLPEAAAVAGEAEEDAETEQDGEEGEEQAARGDQQGSGERRRRRGRRGGRRRRGGNEEGLAGSIGDELGGNPPSEATDAVADFDSSGSETAPSIAHSEHIAPIEPQMSQPEPQLQAPAETPVLPAPAAAVVEEEPASDDKAAARRRSTVREKVSFLSSSPSEPATAVAAAPEPVAPAEPAPEAATETPAAPRRAGWWSRRFGGGE
jgi:ribonuclease E